MKWASLPRTDHVFTHFDEVTGVQTTLAADRIRACVELVTKLDPSFIACCPITDEDADIIRRKRGLEPARLRRAMKTKKYQPLLFINMPDNTQLLIDGSHTYVALHAKGFKSAAAYLVPEIMWRAFVIEDMPRFSSEEHMLNTPSGIKT